MVKITKTFVKDGNAVCNVDNPRKTTFPVYYDNKIALNIKISKNNKVAIVYNRKDIENLSKEELKKTFNVALKTINNFDLSFSNVSCKGFSNDAPNMPREIERDYVLIKKSVEDDKIIMISTETRDVLIQNDIPFVGYAGEKSIPYHTNVNNTENIVGKYDTHEEDEGIILTINLYAKDENDFEENKVLVNKDILEQKFNVYKIEDILKTVLPDNNHIDGACPPNRLYASIHRSSGSYKYDNNTILDFSRINYSFNEYNVKEYQRNETIHKEMETIKCNPSFHPFNFSLISRGRTRKKNCIYPSYMDVFFKNKEEFVKWSKKYHNDINIKKNFQPNI